MKFMYGTNMKNRRNNKNAGCATECNTSIEIQERGSISPSKRTISTILLVDSKENSTQKDNKQKPQIVLGEMLANHLS